MGWICQKKWHKLMLTIENCLFSYRLHKVDNTLGAPANFLAHVVVLVEASGPGDDGLCPPVRHPVILALVLHNSDDDRVRDRAADVGGHHGVQALVPGDVVLKEECMNVRWVMMSLNSRSFFERMIILVPNNLK